MEDLRQKFPQVADAINRMAIANQEVGCFLENYRSTVIQGEEGTRISRLTKLDIYHCKLNSLIDIRIRGI